MIGFLMSFQNSLLNVHVLLLIIVDLLLLYMTYRGVCFAVKLRWSLPLAFMAMKREVRKQRKRELVILPLLIRKGIIAPGTRLNDREFNMLAMRLKAQGIYSELDIKDLPDSPYDSCDPRLRW